MENPQSARRMMQDFRMYFNPSSLDEPSQARTRILRKNSKNEIDPTKYY